MSKTKQLEDALIAADAAGDEEGAQVLAEELKRTREPAGGGARGVFDDLARGLGKTVVGVPELLLNAGEASRAAVSGRPAAPDWSWSRGVEKSIPTPQGDPQWRQYARKGLEAVGGAGPTLPLAPAMGAASAFTSGVSGELGNVLSEGNPLVTLLASLLGGGSVPAVAGAGVKGYRLAEQMAPAGRDAAKGRLLNDLTGDRREAVIAALERNKAYVPGVQPTAAAVASPAGSTELAALERLLEKRFRPSDYRDLRQRNQNALTAYEMKAEAAPPTGAMARDARGRFTGAREEGGTEMLLRVLAERGREQAVRGQASAGATKTAAEVAAATTPTLPPAILDRTVMVVRNVMSRIQGKASKATLEELATDLRDPTKVAALMKRATPEERRLLSEAIMQLGAAQVPATVTQE